MGILLAGAGELLKSRISGLLMLLLHANNICLMAEELELGTCILGWFNEKNLKNLLNINKNKRGRLVIAIGYPADKTVRKKVRKDLNDIYTIYE